MLDELFAAGAGLSRLAGLAPRDIALTRSIVTVALRRLGTIRQALAALLESGLPRPAATQIESCLTVAAAQILFLDVPDHAAVDLAVRMIAPRSRKLLLMPPWSMACYATSSAGARPSSPTARRSIRIRPLGSRRAGARLMARRRHRRSPPPIGSNRRSTSASNPIPRFGREKLGATRAADRLAAAFDSPSRSPNCPAMRKAHGGCRTRRRRCRRDSSTSRRA